MHPLELRETLSRLGWTQTDLARKLGRKPNAVSDWATGLVPVPQYAREYLRMAELMRKGLNG